MKYQKLEYYDIFPHVGSTLVLWLLYVILDKGRTAKSPCEEQVQKI